MKTLKTLLSVFAIAAVFSAGAFAQSSTASDDVEATATVVSGITAGTPVSLDFGTIAQGETPSISSQSAEAGYLNFSGVVSSNAFDVTVTYPDSLKFAVGDGIDLADPTTSSVTYGYDATADASGSGTLTNATVNTLTFTGETAAATGTDDLFIYVGAAIANSDNASTGNAHTGNINISVSYQ